MKYSAINIGPVVKTLGLARKPRELWSASFLFSDLMSYIMNEVPGSVEVIAPAPCPSHCGVGLYPDRLFLKGEISDQALQGLIDKAWEAFRKDVFPGVTADVRSYFSIMTASVEVGEDYKAIKELNGVLDLMELNARTADSSSVEAILDLIQLKYGSPLFLHGMGERSFDVDTLEEIARAGLPSEANVQKTYQNYICIVQADGDNVGTYLTSPKLKQGDMPEVSKALADFGLNAKTLIEEFGGMPIYAGGDDLLFMAPVVGKDGRTNIFDLLEVIDGSAFDAVRKMIPDASLSYGLSVTYYKYPLFEALETARTLLFDVAKKVDGKKAVAWTLQKHSGGQFSAAFSRTPELWNEFKAVIANTTDGNTVSAVAHKIREFAQLVDRVLASGSEVRLKAFFDKILEMKGTPYFDSVKDIITTLYAQCGPEAYADMLYAILRTAKFVKGEELKDE